MTPMGAAVAVAGGVATMTRLLGPVGVSSTRGEIEEGTMGSRFWVRCVLIRWQGQASLDLLQVEQIVILPTHDISQPHSIQVLGNGSVAIQPIQSHNGTIQREMPMDLIAGDDLCSSQELAPVISIPLLSKRAHPLRRMSLKNRGACANDFTTFAS